jgi:hypothetical protein
VWRAAVAAATQQNNAGPTDVYVGTMSARIRRLHLGRLAIATPIVVPVAVWLATLEGGLIIGAGPHGDGCRSFWGESVERVAWSPSGEFLVVSAQTFEADSGEASVRVFRWPGMDVVSRSTMVHATTGYTIDDGGVVAWSTDGFRDSAAIEPVPPTFWRMEPGRAPTTSDVGLTGPSRTLRASRDVSALGVMAEASAPASGRPNQLCVRPAATDSLPADEPPIARRGSGGRRISS